MALTVANNASSLVAQNNLSRTTRGLTKSLERLPSGLKVNRGADGLAALEISEKQRAQIAGIKSAIEKFRESRFCCSDDRRRAQRNQRLVDKSAKPGVGLREYRCQRCRRSCSQPGGNHQRVGYDRSHRQQHQYANKKLLDGSSGVNGVVSDTDVSFIKATANTAAGNYALEVTTTGKRGVAEAGTAQASALAADEILIVNSVSITLSAGLTQTDVINRINEFSSQTGAVADGNGTDSATRLYSQAFGTSASVDVISNVAAAGISSGFGTSNISGTGANVVATVRGVSFNGQGNVLNVNSGAAKDLTINFAANTGVNAHQTVTGTQGNITIANDSLIFQIGANRDQTASLGISKVNPGSLGVAIQGNQFGSLNNIDVTSASKTQDARRKTPSMLSTPPSMR